MEGVLYKWTNYLAGRQGGRARGAAVGARLGLGRDAALLPPPRGVLGVPRAAGAVGNALAETFVLGAKPRRAAERCHGGGPGAAVAWSSGAGPRDAPGGAAPALPALAWCGRPHWPNCPRQPPG